VTGVSNGVAGGEAFIIVINSTTSFLHLKIRLAERKKNYFRENISSPLLNPDIPVPKGSSYFFHCRSLRTSQHIYFTNLMLDSFQRVNYI
jgi:hypothetical protein